MRPDPTGFFDQRTCLSSDLITSNMLHPKQPGCFQNFIRFWCYLFSPSFCGPIMKMSTNPGIYPHQPPPKPLWANKGEKGRTHVFPATASPYTTGKDKAEPSTTVVGPKWRGVSTPFAPVYLRQKDSPKKVELLSFKF